jgi:hypothetical protein
MNLFLPIPADARPRFILCEVRGEHEACDEIAFWYCHPSGLLTMKIAMCDKHKQEAEHVQDGAE